MSKVIPFPTQKLKVIRFEVGRRRINLTFPVCVLCKSEVGKKRWGLPHLLCDSCFKSRI